MLVCFLMSLVFTNLALFTILIVLVCLHNFRCLSHIHWRDSHFHLLLLPSSHFIWYLLLFKFFDDHFWRDPLPRTLTTGTAVLQWTSLLPQLVLEHAPLPRTIWNTTISNNLQMAYSLEFSSQIIPLDITPLSALTAWIPDMISNVIWPLNASSISIPPFLNNTLDLPPQTTCSQIPLVHLIIHPLLLTPDY
jgi:hypothetical protein